jgi:sigma-B regulation protein RsbU (phosphoserine phosphatase)
MIREALEPYTWDSAATLAAELTADGTIARANAAFERLAGGSLEGVRMAELVVEQQQEALERRVADAGPAWRQSTFGLKPDGARPVTDRQVWLRRAGDTVLLVAEAAVGEQELLVEKVLELNDDLVTAHRELVRQRRELQEAVQRVRDLEAISAAGLANLRMDELLPAVLEAIAGAVGSERAVILLRDEEDDVLVGRAAVGLDAAVLASIRVPMGAGVAGRIAATREPMVIPDLGAVEVHSAYLRETSRSMAGVPLVLEGDVIGVLHVTSDAPARFSEADLNLLVPAAERAALAIGRARVADRERRIAETLQRSLLPDVLPGLEGFELAARFVPGAGVEVGGDWYDALPLPQGGLAVVIGDVAGKGLRAATLMGELRAGLRAYAIEGGGPRATLTRLDRLARRNGHMATAVLLHLQAGGERLEFCSAGHLPPLHIGADGRASFLTGGTAPPLLAYGEGDPAVPLPLERGARVLLYTDGLVERRREPIDEGLERLRVAAGGFDGPLDALCDHLLEAMRPPPGARHDDIALIAVSRCSQ